MSQCRVGDCGWTRDADADDTTAVFMVAGNLAAPFAANNREASGRS